MIPTGWHIEYNPKPIPSRSFDWDFWHDDYDYSYPDSTISAQLAGTASSREDAAEQIRIIELEA